MCVTFKASKLAYVKDRIQKMPRIMQNKTSPLQTTLLNAIYTLTLSACEQTHTLKCRDYDVFISSKNVRAYMGVERSSTYQNKVLSELVETGWLKRIERFEGYPNGMYFYALTQAAFHHLDAHKRASGFLIVEAEENRVITVNGKQEIFDFTK